jgi:corrinoid protein of di/trimethylamine methyltransferase
MMSLEQLGKLVEDGDVEAAAELGAKLLENGADPIEMIDMLTRTMKHMGELFAKLDIFLPEIMMAGDALTAVVKVLGPYLEKVGGRASKGKVVICVVRGDLHEIGKNIVKLVLETSGFEVKDLGYDVDSLIFVREAQAMGADFIASSSLMTTTMPRQKEIIEILKDKGIRDKFKVVIGGAPTSQLWADKIGADLYCYGYPMNHQKTLFDLADGLSIGVRINAAFLMEPVKTISCFTLLHSEKSVNTAAEKCSLCRLPRCQFRQGPSFVTHVKKQQE